MLGVGAACQQVDVVVGTAGLARVDAARWVVGRWPARRRLAGTGLGDEPASAVMHDRILHRNLQPSALASTHSIEQRANNAERHQHAGTGLADRRALPDR